MSVSTTSTTNPRQKSRKLLERYLPPIPEEQVLDWIKLSLASGSIVLDPFGAAPGLAVASAQSGIRVLVAANNPISRLLIELAANPPTREQSRSALSTLAALRVRDERVELHIQDLYRTSCPNCDSDITAKTFLWEQDASEPHARILSCNHCGESGEFPLTAADLQRASQYKPGGLHHARALGRIAPPNDPDRIYVEEALNVYPPRAIYALLTLVNKLDQLDANFEQIRILMGMFLNAFDQANTLWAHPVTRERPKQLTIPPIYLEHNIWQALEEAVNLWNSDEIAVPITHWPNLPPRSGGICLFEGRIKDLVHQDTEIEVSAVLTAFPRPNQAFWSLSALWAGWLWGHEAVEHFKPVLRRRRYDWSWHSTATHAALNSLITIIPKGAKLKGLIGEAEPGFISAVIIAADCAGLQLDHFHLYPDKKLALIGWQIDPTKDTSKDASSKQNDQCAKVVKESAQGYLLAKGEPSRYLQLHSAVLEQIGRQDLLIPGDSPAENYNFLHKTIQDTLNYRNGFLRFGGSKKTLDAGWWWLSDDSRATIPLSDRVEVAVVHYLISHPSSSFKDLEIALLDEYTDEEFSGQLIPDSTLIAECLESYGVYDGHGWHIKDQDSPEKRRLEIKSMTKLISGLGEQLGFRVNENEVESGFQSTWFDESGDERYAFFFSASALLGKYIINVDPSPACGIIVLPGGRANLVMFKIRRDPRLQSSIQEKWRFIKYRHARQLASSSTLDRENLDSQLDLDPLTYDETQLRMF